ncbi:hypothetical protein AB0C21_23965 [Spirillospora sp. NPDC049024]
MNGRQRGSRAVGSAFAAAVIAATQLVGSGAHGATAAAAVSSPVGGRAATAGYEVSNHDQKVALYTAMRKLWSDHMHWTYATVDAFFHNRAALQPTLDRLLQNQREIGGSFEPFYGPAAANRLTDLLLTHIKLAVPVLQAAQAGDQARLRDAMAAWYANARQIADFLTKLNPRNWPRSATRPIMREHITQTKVYSVDLLKGDYKKSITDFELALRHMLKLSDILAGGIIAQFPDRFRASS